MWQPTSKQWTVICAVALVVVLGWPSDSGPSLGMKLAAWAVDPRGALPSPPPALPMGRDDDGDAVAEHDQLESAYLHAREQSAVTRWRMDMKSAVDPLDPSTQRQLLVGVVVLAGLAVWRMDRTGAKGPS